jgi:hypothetical protein
MPDYTQYRLLPLTARSPIDPRDFCYATPPPPDVLAAIRAGTLPDAVDLHAQGLMPDPWDQGQEGSCAGHMAAAIMVESYRKAGQHLPERFAPAYVYYRGRAVEGWQSQDNGSYPRDDLQSMVDAGICFERFMPYQPGQYAQAPSAQADADATLHKLGRYEALPNWQTCVQALADARFIGVGMPWYQEWYTPAPGGLLDRPTSAQPVGGHAPGFCGYKSFAGRLYFRLHNSWGTGWADAGHAWLPADISDTYLWERWVGYSVVELEAPVTKTVACTETAALHFAPQITAAVQLAPAPAPNRVQAALASEFVRFANELAACGIAVQELIKGLSA